MSEPEGLVHDWLAEPLELPDDAELDAIMCRIVPLIEQRPDRRIVLVTPGNETRSIAGATLGAACVGCGQRVWVSPSTRPDIGRALFVCTACFTREAGESLQTGRFAALARAAVKAGKMKVKR